ncbi:MAG TPA: four helix bundle protein [Chitinophagaceae bacterium]|nr:four helix bundle protein [Chitinophagaceae bacterium]
MITQIRRAALSVHLNIEEDPSRKSEAERKRYYEIARGSAIEIDAALDTGANLAQLDGITTESLGESMIRCFKILTGPIGITKINDCSIFTIDHSQLTHYARRTY